GRANLADQLALSPDASGHVPEVGHLRGHAAIAGAGADDDRIVVRKLVRRGNRRCLVELVSALAGHVLRHQFGNPSQYRLRSCGPGAFRDSLSHRLDMAVARVVENQHSGHVRSFRPCVDRLKVSSCNIRLGFRPRSETMETYRFGSWS